MKQQQNILKILEVKIAVCTSKFYKQKWTFKFGNEYNKVLCGLGSPHGLKKQWDDFSWWSQLVHKHHDCVDVNHCFLVQGTNWPAEAFNHHTLWNVPFLDFQNDKHRMQWLRTGSTCQQCRRFRSIFAAACCMGSCIDSYDSEHDLNQYCHSSDVFKGVERLHI